MKRSWQALALLALSAALAACARPAATPTPTPKPMPTPIFVPVTTIQDLLGTTWHAEGNDGMYQRFTEDGTMITAVSLESLSKGGDAVCSARFEGDQLILTEISSAGLPSCGTVVGKYQVRRLPSGDILFVASGDSCAPRRRSTAQVHKAVK